MRDAKLIKDITENGNKINYRFKKIDLQKFNDDLKEKFGPILSENIGSLPVGKWQALESDDSLLLVRLNGIQGGLPSREVLRPQLTYDWLNSKQKQAVEGVVQEVVSRYRFKEIP